MPPSASSSPCSVWEYSFHSFSSVWGGLDRSGGKETKQLWTSPLRNISGASEPKAARQWREHPRRKHERQRRQKPDGQNESRRNQKRAKSNKRSKDLLSSLRNAAVWTLLCTGGAIRDLCLKIAQSYGDGVGEQKVIVYDSEGEVCYPLKALTAKRTTTVRAREFIEYLEGMAANGGRDEERREADKDALWRLGEDKKGPFPQQRRESNKKENLCTLL
jgi:hypothetical protein